MGISQQITRIYFNLVYNPVYDFTTGKLAAYRRLQSRCVGKFRFNDGEKVLCIGVGTGNELLNILEKDCKVQVVGVDYSDAALRRARRKTADLGSEVTLLRMDARNLQFPEESFDKVLCVHVMDFIDDILGTTEEIFRVLKKGGQFVITYPSEGEGMSLGLSLLKDNIHASRHSAKIMRVLSGFASSLVSGFVYIPLMFRKGKKTFPRAVIERLFSRFKCAHFEIEHYPIYHDFIVFGTK